MSDRAFRGRGSGLRRIDLDPDPFCQFRLWYLEFCAAGLSTEPAAMQLATVSGAGEPSLRTVLLKRHDEGGFVFYTNRQSAKARDIAGNCCVSLLFFWVWLDRQIRIQGRAREVPDADADRYFASRSRDSQIGAWASCQSSVVGSRADLEARYQEYEQRFAGRDVRRPPHWGGYRVIPDSFEFWQGRAGRMHDRFVYARSQGVGGDQVWKIERLAP